MTSTETVPDDQAKIVDAQQPAVPVQVPAVISNPAPRENMIETAVRFLTKPQVRSSPLAQKKVFLQKKGLTAQEIEIAIERSGTKQDIVAAVSPGQTPTSQAMVPHHGVPMQQQMVPAGQPVPSRMSKWRDYMAVAVIFSGVSFGIYKLVQHLLMPFIKSRQEERERLERLEASMQELNNNITRTVQEVENAVKSIQGLLELQQSKLDNLNSNMATSQAITTSSKTTDIADVKAEITSLKGLLLNRHQFPATPQPSPIPAWQRVGPATSTTPVKPSDNPSPPPTSPQTTETKMATADTQNASEVGLANGDLEDASHRDGLVNGDSDGSGKFGEAETPDLDTEENEDSVQRNVNQTEAVLAT